MRISWLVLLMLTVALAFSGLLMADQGKGKGKGNPHAQAWEDEDRHGHDDGRWERRDKYEYRVYNQHDGVPPGWSKGKKTGWGNCGLPPGQAKKYGCRTYVYEGRPYYYYHDEAGRIVIRRPTIHIEGAVDIH